MGKADFFKNTVRVAGEAAKNGGETLAKLGGELIEEIKAQDKKRDEEGAALTAKEASSMQFPFEVPDGDAAETELDSGVATEAGVAANAEQASAESEGEVLPHLVNAPSGPFSSSDAAGLESPKSARKPKNRTTIAVGIVAALLAFFVGWMGGSGSADSRAESERADLVAQHQAEVDQLQEGFDKQLADLEERESNLAEESNLTVLVNAEGWTDAKGKVGITVTGSTDEGEEVKDSFEAAPNESFELKDYKAGIYLVSIDASSIKDGNNVYQSDSMKVAFSDRSDLEIELDLKLDAEATKQKEDEAKAKEEEAAKAKAEEEARAQAEAEAKAQEEQAAAAAAAAAASAERTVYVTPTGTKYHASGCRYLKGNGTAISLSEAQARGLEACSVCGG